MSRSLTILALLLFVLVLAGACTDSTDDSVADGDSSDGDTSDGDEPDGDGPVIVPDGDETDGDEPDGDIADGDPVDGDDLDGDADEPVDGDDTDGDVTPILPVAACDMAPYDLLPRQDVGQLLDFEATLIDLSSAAVDGMLKTAGYEQLTPVPFGAKVYRFRYTTQDRGQPVEATAYLAIPTGDELPEAPRPLALFGHGTTGFSDPCAPTAAEFEGPLLPAFLASHGFVSVAPDYIGMNGYGEPSTVRHGYMVGEQTAIGSWDALRAGLELIDDNLSEAVNVSHTDTIIWGGSQGGYMALFTELYGPYYAPEFDVKGVVALVPPTVIKPLVEYALEFKSPPTVSLIPIVTTMRRWYGKPDTLDEVFTNVDPYYLADDVENYVFPQESCDPGLDIEWDDIEISDVFTADFIDAGKNGRWDELSPWDCYFTENALATSSVTPLRYTPTLMVYSEDDDLVITSYMRDDYVRLCDLGYQMDYLECANAGHSEGAVWSMPEQLAWVQDRLDGVPLDSATSCQVHQPVCCEATPEGECDAAE